MFKLLKRHQTTIIFSLIFGLSLFIRFFQISKPVFKEDENTTINAAAYLYYCQQDIKNCLAVSDTFKSKLFTLITNNETKPNLITQIYFWDWVKDRPTNTHYARAWPHLYLIKLVYQKMGISHLSSRLISLISGSFLVIVAYFLGKLVNLSSLISLTYALSLAISYHLILISRSSRMYALFSLSFLITVYLLNRFFTSKKLVFLITALTVFVLIYFLHLISLLLPLSLLFFALYQVIVRGQTSYKPLAMVLSLLILFLVILGQQLNLNFFHTYFMSFSRLPSWKYLQFVFGTKYLSLFGWGVILINLKKILRFTSSAWLFFILITHLTFLIFFSHLPASSVYVIHLLPLSYLLVFICLKNYFSLGTFFGLVSLSLVLNLQSLYLPPFDRPQLTHAYQQIINRFKPHDQLIGFQLRDYYLQDLPLSANVLNLSPGQVYTLDQFKDFQKPNTVTFIVFEIEKQEYLSPDLINHLQKNATKLTGQNLDSTQVETYLTYKDSPRR